MFWLVLFCLNRKIRCLIWCIFCVMFCEMVGRVIKVEVDGKFLISELINVNIDLE